MLAAALSIALLALVLRGAGEDGDRGPGARGEVASEEGGGQQAGGEPGADVRPGALRARRIGSFRAPLDLAEMPGRPDVLWVVEKAGRIRTVGPGGRQRTFLDIRDEVRHQGTEQGLLSIAFPHDHQRTRLLYVSFTDQAGDLAIVELRRREGRALRPDGHWRRLLTIRQPGDTHQGGELVFGPDRRLYIGAGDGGPSHDPRGDGQNRTTLRGTILRIDPRPDGRRRYGIPRRNPFAGERPGRPEIWVYGLRNPWRFSFDRRTGDLWIADVGQDVWEEINHLPRRRSRGANLGWAGYEGPAVFRRSDRAPNAIPPTFAYRHGRRGCSVIGGHVIRHPSYGRWSGRYVYGDFCSGAVRSLAVPRPGRSERDDRATGLELPGLASFAEGLDGRLYALSLQGGVYRLLPPRPPARHG